MKVISRHNLARRAASSASASLCPPPLCLCKANRRTFSSTRSQLAFAPPPPSGYTQLQGRRLISIAGPDAAKFLQGLVTSSLYTSDNQPRSDGFYTGFLTAQGRVLHDAFIYPDTLRVGVAAADLSPAPHEALLIEVDAKEAENLKRLIKRYKLRSQFKFRLLEPDECTVWQAWDDTKSGSGESAQSPVMDEESSIVLRDGRAPAMGHRVLTTRVGGPQVELERELEVAYRIRRYLQGVPEGPLEIPQGMLPLDANMELMGGIDFRKGCYVGQELTVRTKHRGVVRKRILPCMLYGEDEPVPVRMEVNPETSILAQDLPGSIRITEEGKKSRTSSTWLHGIHNIGLAVCRLESMTDLPMPGEAAVEKHSRESFILVGADEEGKGGHKVMVKAFVPDWLRTRLDEMWGGAAKH